MTSLVPADVEPLAPLTILHQNRRRLLTGALITGLTFGGGGGWAALAPLDSAAVAAGVVGADGRNKVVQHLEGGIIAELDAKEGDHVAAQQVLVRLDQTRARASVDQLQGELDSQRAMTARLTAERDGLTSVAFPADLDARRATEPEVARILTGQQALFEARRNYLVGERDVLQSRVGQYQQEIAGLDAQRVAAEQQMALIETEAKVVRVLVDAGQERKPRLLGLERDAARLGGDRGNSIALMSRARENIGETQLRISQLDLDRLNQVVNDLRDTETKVFETSEKLRAACDILDRTVVKAPIAGTLIRMNVHTVGGVVQAGENMMEIVPTDDRLLIDAHLKPQDIAAVHPGETAEVRLDAYSARRMPMMLGKVVEVSADALKDKSDAPSYFLLRVAVDKASLAKLPNVSLYPGMPAEVMVVTGKRTMLDYIVMPITTSLRHAFTEE